MTTPIGNLGDISIRAIEVLSKCECVVSEDTRTTKKLLTHLKIEGKKLISYYEGKEKEKLPIIISILQQGMDVALVSEAGSPVICDPGYLLVKECRKNNIKVSVIPGPCAPIAALMISGIEPLPFTFLGFLPRKQGDLKELFFKFKDIKTTLIFFERKSRIKNSLKIACEILGEDREVAVVRELTKLHEEVIYFPISQYEKLEDVKGELTVIISPSRDKIFKTPMSYVEDLIADKIDSGLPAKHIVKEVLSEVAGWNKKDIYELFLRMKNGQR